MMSSTSRKPSSSALFCDKRSALTRNKTRRKPSTREKVFNNIDDGPKSSNSLPQPHILPPGGGELLLQLRQQQQNLAALMAGPNIAQGPYTSPPYTGMVQPFVATSCTLPIEKSGQAFEQLGLVLEQMKQDSEGSAAAWREQLAETARLTDQLAQMQEQLNSAKFNERARSDELGNAQEALKTLEAQVLQNLNRHREDLRLLNDKIERQDQCTKEMHEEHEAALNRVQTQLSNVCIHHEEEKRVLSDEFRKNMDQCQLAYDVKMKELCSQHATEVQKLIQQANEHEHAKLELGQHLWNVTNEVEAALKREQELQMQAQNSQQEVLKLRNLALSREKESALLSEALEDLMKQLKDTTARENGELTQKNDLKAQMVAEVANFQAQLEQMGQQLAAALAGRGKQAEEEQIKALKVQKNTEAEVHESQSEVRHLSAKVYNLKAKKARLEAQISTDSDAVMELTKQLQEIKIRYEKSRSQVQQLASRCETAGSVTLQCINLLKQTNLGLLANVYTESQDNNSDDPLAQLPLIFIGLEQLKATSDALEPLQLEITLLRQEKEKEHEKFQIRERKLQLQTQDTEQELQVAQQDAKALAEELAQLAQVAQDHEALHSQLNEQIIQQNQELVRLRSESASQLLQLQKVLDMQRARSASLESEKRDLVSEAERLNLNLETQYRAVKGKQLELEQVRGLHRDLELRHGDLQETFSDLENSARKTSEQFVSRLQQANKYTDEKMRQIDDLQKRLEGMTQLLSNERDETARAREFELTQRSQSDEEIFKVLTEKNQRIEDLLAQVTQLQTKIDHLDQIHVKDREIHRQRCDIFAEQLSDAQEAQLQAEMTVAATTQLHQDTQSNAQLEMEQLRATFLPQIARLEAQKESQIAELQRVNIELDCVSRSKQALQHEVQRALDDTQDALRAAEVAHRDARLQAELSKDEMQGVRLELEAARLEARENATLSEEMQNKMTTIQNAANATIDEIAAELQNTQDALNLERVRAKKEKEAGATRAQIRELEDQIRLRDAQVRTNREEATRAQDELEERVSELGLQLQRTANTLGSKKLESEAKTQEIEVLTRRVQEAERKLPILIAAHDTIHARAVDLKRSLESKVREAQDCEEKARDEAFQIARERRAFDHQLTELRDENEALQQQITRFIRQEETIKQALEQTKSELYRVAAELRATMQKFENVQKTASQTIADITSRMQQSERTATRLQQELDFERDRRREAEVLRVEMQRTLHHHVQLSSSDLDGSIQIQDKTSDLNLDVANQTSLSREYRKFYDNEPLTSGELSTLPMATIKAQLGLEFSQNNMCLPTKPCTSAIMLKSPKNHHMEKEDAIPLLPLEKIPLSPEDGDDSAKSNVGLSDKRSRPQVVDTTSSRSSNNSHLLLSRDNAASLVINTCTASSTGKSAAIKKKKSKPPRSSGRLFTSYNSSSMSPVKAKERDKILPRISAQ
ncbi:hypothetical protein Plhal703r1_c45g0147071 [Plasmopara halstedii]